MSVISKVNDDSVVKEKDFPKLMISEKGNIVLFSARGVGTTLVKSKYSSQGEYGSRWSMSVFKDFNGSVTLSNE